MVTIPADGGEKFRKNRYGKTREQLARLNKEGVPGRGEKKAGFDPRLFPLPLYSFPVYFLCSMRSRAASSLILTAASFTLAQPYQCM